MTSSLEEISHKLTEIMNPLGLECYPFKIGWYNLKVGKEFHFNMPDETLAFVIISMPTMFDKAFKPFIWRQDCLGQGDQLDSCMRHHFTVIQKHFPSLSIECIHDFELQHSRRPKILVQTAGHVAGAVYYYQRSDIKNDPWKPNEKIYGVCVHPKYGGWFALRGVFIFRNVLVPTLQQKSPPDVIPDDERRIKLLEQFNFNYKNWQFRDVIDPVERYSDQQKEYFGTPPGDRVKLIQKILDEKPANVNVLL